MTAYQESETVPVAMHDSASACTEGTQRQTGPLDSTPLLSLPPGILDAIDDPTLPSYSSCASKPGGRPDNHRHKTQVRVEPKRRPSNGVRTPSEALGHALRMVCASALALILPTVAVHAAQVGTKLWERNLGATITAGPSIGPSGIVYGTATDGSLHAINLGSGAELWKYDTVQLGMLRFTLKDIRDLRSLATKLKSAATPISAYVAGRLGSSARSFLRNWDGTSDPDSFKYYLEEDLVRIQFGPSIWEPARFENIALRPETRALAESNPTGPTGFRSEISRLNRLLLEDAYPEGILADRPTSNSVTISPPVISPDGTVFVVSSADENLHALESSTGVRKWRTSLEYKTDDYTRLMALDGLGRLYVLRDNGRTGTSQKRILIAIDAKSGTNLWRSETDHGVDGPVVAADGTVILQGDDDAVYALNPDNGRLVWKASIPEGSIHAPVLSADGAVLIGGDRGTLYAINPSTGARRWQASVPGAYRLRTTTVAANGSMYVGFETSSGNYGIQAIDESGKALSWLFNYRNGDSYLGDAALSANGVLYCAFGTNVVAIDTSTGTKAWEAGVGTRVVPSPIISPDGTVLIVTADGFIHAFQGDSGSPSHGWPMRRRDAQLSGRLASDGAASILSPPESTTAARGATTTLSVTAGGTPPLNYQWYKDGVPLADGERLSGAKTSALTLFGTEDTDAGQYSVSVRSAVGDATVSPMATVSIVPPADGQVLWTLDLMESPFQGSTTATIDKNNRLFVRTDKALTAIDLFSGRVRWRIPASGNALPVVADDGTLYLGFQAIDPTTGVEQKTGHPQARLALGQSGLLFGISGTLDAVDSKTGETIWSMPAADGWAGSPVVAPDGTIYARTAAGYPKPPTVFGVSPVNGDVLLEIPLDPGNTYNSDTTALGAKGTVYVAAADASRGELRAYAPFTGRLLWKFQTGYSPSGAPTVGSNELLILSNGKQMTFAIDGNNGTEKWRFTSTGSAATAAIARDGGVYLADSAGLVYALEELTGTLRWKTKVDPTRPLSAPCVAPSGRIVVVDRDGRVHCLYGKSPLADSAWPMLGRDAGHSGRVSLEGAARIEMQPLPAEGMEGSRVRLGVVAVGTLPIRYHWQRNGQDLQEGERYLGVNSASLTVVNLQPGDAGQYSVRVISAEGTEVMSDSVDLTVRAATAGATRWERVLRFTNRFKYTSPSLGIDGTVYSGSEEGFVFGVNGATGELKWNKRLNGAVIAPIVADLDGAIYVETRNGTLHCLDGQTGQSKWSATGVGDVAATVAVGQGALLYGGVGSSGVVGRRKADGEIVWTFADGGRLRTTPLIGPDGIVYVGTGNRQLWALKGETGERVWGFVADADFGGSCVALGWDGVVYLGGGKKIYALDSATGAKLWDKASTSSGWGFPTIDIDGTLYLGTDDNRLYALNPSDGAVLWSFQTGDWIRGAAAVASDGTVLVQSRDGFLYTLEAGSGTQRWRFQTLKGTDNYEDNSPAIGADGTVYISRGGRLFAVFGSSPLATSPWPMEGRDARHSGRQPAIGAPEILHLKPMYQRIDPGTSAQIDLKAIGLDPLEVQWFELGEDGTTGAVAGATNALLATGTLERPRWYWAVVSNSVGVVTTGLSLVDVPAPPLITNQPAGGVVRLGTSALLSVHASGQQPMRYQWYQGSSGQTDIPVGGATNNTFETPPVTNAIQYWVRVSNERGAADSAAAAWTTRGPIPGELVWKTTLPDVVGSVALDDQGGLTVGAANQRLYHLDAATGELKWEFPVDGTILHPPVASARRRILGAGSHFLSGSKIFQLDGQTGTMEWTVSTPGAGSLVLDDGATPTSFFLGSPNAMGISATDGATRWSVSGFYFHRRAAITRSGLIVCTTSEPGIAPGDKVVALRASDGAKQWEFASILRRFSPPALGQDDTVYLGTGQSNLLALAGATGQKKWEIGMSGEVSASPAVGSDGTVYVNSLRSSQIGDILIAVDGLTGVKKWETTVGKGGFRPSGSESSAPALDAAGTVYLGSVDGGLYAIDTQGGQVRWRYETGAPIVTSPSIGSDALVYIGSRSNLFAIKASGPLADAPWPKFSQNARNTGRALPVEPPTFTRQPGTSAIAAGQTATLEVVATGSAPLSYQWYLGNAPAVDNPIEGATGNTYRTPPLTSSASYWVRVRNAAGHADSATAVVTVGSPPVITRQPEAVRIARGGPARLSIEASGIGNLAYQWFRGEAGDTGSPIPGATAAEYLIAGVAETAALWVRVSNELGHVDSVGLTIMILDPPTIVSPPSSVEVLRGASARFAVGATGSAPLAFQWYLGESGDVSKPIVDGVTETLITPGLDQTTAYWVRVGNEVGAADSATARATVVVPTVQIAATRTPEGRLMLRIQGTAGTRWIVEVSEDLRSWSAGTPPASLTLDSGGIAVVELPVAPAAAWFCRLIYTP